MMSLFRLTACFKYVMMTAILAHASCPVLAQYGMKRSAIFLERTREGHRQSVEHWNCFKGIVGETSERRGRAHMGFSELFFAMSMTFIFFLIHRASWVCTSQYYALYGTMPVTDQYWPGKCPCSGLFLWFPLSCLFFFSTGRPEFVRTNTRPVPDQYWPGKCPCSGVFFCDSHFLCFFHRASWVSTSQYQASTRSVLAWEVSL